MYDIADSLPVWCDVAALRRYFSINRKEAWRMIANKHVKAKKWGKYWKIQTASVLKFLNKGTNLGRENGETATEE